MLVIHPVPTLTLKWSKRRLCPYETLSTHIENLKSYKLLYKLWILLFMRWKNIGWELEGKEMGMKQEKYHIFSDYRTHWTIRHTYVLEEKNRKKSHSTASPPPTPHLQRAR